MIKIEAIGTDEDRQNPYYKKHDAFCNEWKQFINNRNGKLKAKYSIWALTLSAQYNSEIKFTSKIKKSIGSGGNLFVSNKVERSIVQFTNLKLKSRQIEIELELELDTTISKLLCVINRNKYQASGKFTIKKLNANSTIDNLEIETILKCMKEIENLTEFKLNTYEKTLTFVTTSLFNNFKLLKLLEEISID